MRKGKILHRSEPPFFIALTRIVLTSLLITTVLFFSGCLVGGKYPGPPPAAIDSTYLYPNQVSNDSITNIQWFALYQDTVLQRLIKTTLDSNRNLLTAAARVEESREIAGIAKSNLYPSIGYQGAAGYGSVGSDAQNAGGGINGSYFQAFATLNWEVDIWGKLRHARRSAQDEFLASQENRNALQVSLVAEVATNYFILRDLDNRLTIAQNTLESRHRNTEIITARFDTGYVSELDKLQAIQQESVAAGAIPEFERQINIVQNSLRVLMGMPPGQVPRGIENVNQAFVPSVPSGLPSQLLERRPDIREINYLVAAQFERVGVAKANQFPSLSLTGLLGFASPSLGTFLGASGFVASGAAGLFGPLFEFGKRRHFTRAEKYRLQEISYQYQEVVLEAFADVDNSLKNYESYSRQYDILHTQVEASRKALELSQARYDFGYTDYTEVIIQQDNLFNAQLEESFILQSKLNSIVGLYRSLGGGW